MDIHFNIYMYHIHNLWILFTNSKYDKSITNIHDSVIDIILYCLHSNIRLIGIQSTTNVLYSQPENGYHNRPSMDSYHQHLFCILLLNTSVIASQYIVSPVIPFIQSEINCIQSTTSIKIYHHYLYYFLYPLYHKHSIDSNIICYEIDGIYDCHETHSN